MRTREATATVKRGAKLLDKAFPDWEAKIDLDFLNMFSYNQCILGQLYGEYETGMCVLFPGMSGDLDLYENNSNRYGFEADLHANRARALTQLEVAWENLILGRAT